MLVKTKNCYTGWQYNSSGKGQMKRGYWRREGKACFLKEWILRQDWEARSWSLGCGYGMCWILKIGLNEAYGWDIEMSQEFCQNTYFFFQQKIPIPL